VQPLLYISTESPAVQFPARETLPPFNSHQTSDSPEGPPVFHGLSSEVIYMDENRPVVVTCRAAPANEIDINCGGEWIPRDRLHIVEIHREMSSSRKDVQASVRLDVSKKDVKYYFCWCHAWNKGSTGRMSSYSKPRQLVLYCKEKYYCISSIQ